jgi:tetrapyrrole methylase family protein/MazG family protein
MRGSLLEETHEVLEAIDLKAMNQLKTELGDLLLQIVFHAQLAEENDDFDLEAIIQDINLKLINRHPHVFGNSKATSTTEVLHNWEILKKRELKKGESMLNGVPKSLPSLAHAQEIQGRVARIGFDWETDDDVIEKLIDEVRELRECSCGEEMEEEYGDVLFALANLARRQGIDLESALRRANGKFRRRFGEMELLSRKRGLKLENLTFVEQNELWFEVKQSEKKRKYS